MLIVHLVKRIMLEPALHFILGGSLIFALYAGLAGQYGQQEYRIHLSERIVQNLMKSHVQRVGQDPSPERRKALIREFVGDEILYREARHRGLDRGDPILRQHLVEKLKGFLNSQIEIGLPSEAELRAFWRRELGGRDVQQFSSDRARVEQAWREAQLTQAEKQAFAEIARNYSVEIESAGQTSRLTGDRL